MLSGMISNDHIHEQVFMNINNFRVLLTFLQLRNLHQMEFNVFGAFANFTSVLQPGRPSHTCPCEEHDEIINSEIAPIDSSDSTSVQGG